MTIPKLQVNIGINNEISLKERINKFANLVQFCVSRNVDILCDMSVDIESVNERNSILKSANIPFCKVPIYDYYLRYGEKYNYCIDKNAFIDLLETETENSPSYILLHSAFTRKIYNDLMLSNRLIKMSSRGGGIIYKHFDTSTDDNPLYVYFDTILKILNKKNITLLLGAATRPGSICDGFDNIFKSEMLVQTELLKIAKYYNSRVIIEGIGHCRISELISWIDYAHELFNDTPLKPLPIVTDISAGLDHISHGIAVYECIKRGVEYLCCITPAEHLGAPTLTDIELAIDTIKIISHIINLDESNESSLLDFKISLARANNDWENVFKFSINPSLAKSKYIKLNKNRSISCSMCGDLCPKILTNKIK